MNKPNVLLSVILLLSLLFNTGTVSAQMSPQTNQAGTVVAWGLDDDGQSTVPEGLNNAIAIDGSWNHSLALTAETAPVINLQPLDQAAYVGEAVSFSAAASGDPAPSLQWQISTDDGTTWTDVAGAITSPLTFTASLDQDGNQYRAVFTNSAGSVTSHAATLSVWEPSSPVVYDDFNDNYVDPALWDVEELGGPTSSETNQRLEITMPADSAGTGGEWGEEFFAWYTSACRLHGDYDIQIDYQLLTWPPTNGIMLGLDDIHVSMGRANLGQSEYGGGHDVYWTHTTINIDEGAFQLGNWIPTSDLSGKLRVQKVDDTIRTFYFGDEGWEPVGSNSDPVYAEDTPILIYGWSWDSIFGDQEVKLAYDNLTINHGELVCPSIYDDFNDNYTDPALWSMEEVGGPTSSETNQRLEITIPANSEGGEFISSSMSTCQLHGDYDIQVDYELLTWPPTNGVRVVFGDERVNPARLSLGQNDYDNGEEHEVYWTETYLNDVGFLIGDIISTNHLSGKLRMQRVGDTISTFYFRQWLWSPIASYSDPAYAEDTPMYLEAGSGDYEFGDQDVKVAFDNLMIYQGELVCSHPPAPDLAVTQVADQETVSTGDPIGFTITITNNGDATASIVTLTNPLPIYNELDWSIGGTDAAACVMVDGVVSCNFQDIPPGAVKTIRLTSPTKFLFGKGFCPNISSTATVMAYNQPVNKTATASTTVLCPSVYIEVLPVNVSISAGDPASYTVTVSSMGEGVARNVLAEVTLPENPGLSWSIANVIPAEAAGNCHYSSGTPSYPHPELICSFDQMDPQQEVVVTLTSPTTSDSCGTLVATGVVALGNGAGFKGKPSPIVVSCPQSVYDNFDDNVTDTSLWTVGQQGGPVVSEMNQRLEITLPADSAGNQFTAAYYSACLLHGDFDIQVDYNLLTWPIANGVRISLGTTHGNMERVSFGPSGDFAGGPEVYLTDYAGLVKGITSTSDLSGKLRLARIGNTITGYYFYNLGWMPVASNSDSTYSQDTGFGLSSWSHDPVFADQEVKIAFDNMKINSGELVCPTAPAPDLAITQVADEETVSTGDPIGFTLTVTNNGDGIANSVTLSDTLSVYPEFSWSVSGTDAAACVLTGGSLSCNFGDMPPGAMKTIRLTAPEYEYYSKCFGLISSTATVMADNQPVNKTATASITVLCPNMYINVWSENPGYPAGSPVSFTTEFGNLGDGIAKNVLVEITLPTNPGLSWSIMNIIPAEAANNCVFGTDSFGVHELICSFDQLPAGQVVTITLTSPTTSESCGMINSVGYLTLSNGRWGRSIMKAPTILCPVVDTTPPVITPTMTGTLGTNGWYTSDVSLTWSYSDPESPISSTSGCEAVSITQNQAATDYTCTATSAGGTSSGTATIKRDNTKPVTSVTNVTEGAAYALGSVPQAGCSSTDNLSGVAKEAILLLTGGDAQGLGYFTAICSGALDAAGNAADHAVVHYTVNKPSSTYNFAGFFQPVDNPGPGPSYVFNSVKAGGAVPVRFSLGGDQGLSIFSPGYPTSRPVSCTTAALSDPIEETVTVGNSSLSYDAASDTYIYVWKTNKAWAGTCRVLTVQLDDGTQHLAYFKFK